MCSFWTVLSSSRMARFNLAYRKTHEAGAAVAVIPGRPRNSIKTGNDTDMPLSSIRSTTLPPRIMHFPLIVAAACVLLVGATPVSHQALGDRETLVERCGDVLKYTGTSSLIKRMIALTLLPHSRARCLPSITITGLNTEPMRLPGAMLFTPLPPNGRTLAFSNTGMHPLFYLLFRRLLIASLQRWKLRRKPGKGT